MDARGLNAFLGAVVFSNSKMATNSGRSNSEDSSSSSSNDNSYSYSRGATKPTLVIYTRDEDSDEEDGEDDEKEEEQVRFKSVNSMEPNFISYIDEVEEEEANSKNASSSDDDEEEADDEGSEKNEKEEEEGGGRESPPPSDLKPKFLRAKRGRTSSSSKTGRERMRAASALPFLLERKLSFNFGVGGESRATSNSHLDVDEDLQSHQNVGANSLLRRSQSSREVSFAKGPLGGSRRFREGWRRMRRKGSFAGGGNVGRSFEDIKENDESQENESGNKNFFFRGLRRTLTLGSVAVEGVSSGLRKGPSFKEMASAWANKSFRQNRRTQSFRHLDKLGRRWETFISGIHIAEIYFTRVGMYQLRHSLFRHLS